MKISSYRKLKLEIKKLKADKLDLENMIADDDKTKMHVVKILVHNRRELARAIWWGSPTSNEKHDGILKQIEKK